MKKVLLLVLSVFICFFSNAQTITIAEIQGTGTDSPLDGQVVTTSGIVTGVAPTSFFIQDDTQVRSGLYVFDQTYAPMVGDSITLTGSVAEYYGLTELVNLTELIIHSSNHVIPPPAILTTAQLTDEDYEGMLVEVNDATCTNTNLGFGEWELNDGSGAGRVDDLIYAFSPELNVDYRVRGPLIYSFGNYKIEPRSEADVEILSQLFFTVAPHESNISNNSLTISWETNIPSNTKISYGLTDALELGTIEDLNMTTTHELVLENLTPSTIYYVQPFSEAGQDVTPLQTIVMATASNSSGEIKVYFNHFVDHSVATNELAVSTNHIIDTIISYINQAQQTLDITMYEAENQAIIDAINTAYDNGVQVRIISDEGADTRNELFDQMNANIPYLEGNADRIMHNKFFIIDREDVDNACVLTGSMNHTIANLGWDYNNIITIQDQSLAKAYTLEFNEMWGGDGAMPDPSNAKFGNEKADNTPHRFSINNIPVELYFSPSDNTGQKIKEAIDAAENEMAFALLVFTENSLGTAVVDAHNRGVNTAGIIDYVESDGSEFDYLISNNVNVIDYQNADMSQWPNGPTLHHKYAIIDYAQGSPTPLLITGSHNWSASANSSNDENTLLIYDHTLANIYYQEFSARFQGLTNVTSIADFEPLEISPNPIDKNLFFKVTEQGQLSVSDATGRIFYQEKIAAGSHEMNTNKWESGIYFIQFVGKNSQQIGKVIKR